MDIVKIEEELKLSTGLRQESFGHLKTSHLLNEKGIIVKIGEKTEFSEYNFETNRPDNGDIVIFAGKPFKGKQLSEIFKTESKESQKKAAALVCSAFTSLINEKIQIQSVGAGGILVNEEQNAVLFLPPETFEWCVANEQQSYNEMQGFYLFKGLTGEESLLFTRAVIAYRALTDKLPFTQQDLSMRQADISDALFMPLEYLINGIDKTLAESINAGLMVKMKEVPLPSEKRYKNEKKESERLQTLKISKEFSEEVFEKELFSDSRKTEIPEAEFLKKQAQFMQSKLRAVKIRRFLRRNKAALTVAAIAVCAVIWGTSSIISTNAELATTKGLDSTQTTALLYSFIHQTNVANLQEVAKGKDMSKVFEIVSSFFVTAKQREGFNSQAKTMPPEEWIFYKPNKNFWTFGITHLSIDGVPFNINNSYPVRKDKTVPLKQEGGKTLTKGDTATHTAKFFFVHNDEKELIIQRTEDTVTLTWDGQRWLVTKMTGTSKIEQMDYQAFLEQFQQELDQNGDNPLKAVDTLRKTYEWLPAESDLHDGMVHLDEIYKNTGLMPFITEQLKNE